MYNYPRSQALVCSHTHKQEPGTKPYVCKEKMAISLTLSIMECYLCTVWTGYKCRYLPSNLLCSRDSVVGQWSHCLTIMLSYHQTAGITVEMGGLVRKYDMVGM